MPVLTSLHRFVACAGATLAILAGFSGLSGDRPEVTRAARAEQKWTATTNPATTASRTEKRRGDTRSGGQRIAVLVNDEPVTAYEIEQRARFLSLSANVGERAKENFQRLVKAESTNARFRALQQEVLRANQGKSREEIIAVFQKRQKEFGMELQRQALESARAVILPKLRKDAERELIDERLKVQAAKKLGIEVGDDVVKTIVKNLAERNKMTSEQFGQHLKGMGIDIATLHERFRAQKAWRDLIGRRYAAQISVTQRDIDRVLSSVAVESGEDTVELHVNKISLALARIDQPTFAKRYSEAEALRRKVRGCRSMAELAKTVPAAKFEDLKSVRPSSIQEPTRSMLLSAKDGDVLPPFTAAAGVEIYALCGRRAVRNEAQRAKTLEQLQSKELEILARRHMRNLRQEADIEHRW
jgi:peptidyl-prolyl cis-trans isomerase SurA